MQNKYLFRRYALFAIALFVNAMGVAYITKAALGTSPITSITYVASMFTPLTMRQWTIILNLLTGCIILAVGIALEVMLNTGSIGLETACQLVAGLYRKTKSAR